MKTIKNLSLLFVAAVISFSVSAQGTAATGNTQTTNTMQKTPATSGSTGSTKSLKTASTGSTGSTKAAPVQTPGTKTGQLTPASNGKTASKVDATRKGPHGETVYIGPNNGHYYLNGSGNKVYLK